MFFTSFLFFIKQLHEKTGTIKPKASKKTKGQNGTKNSINNGSASPTLLKEQLELIHQIIQQAQQEETNNCQQRNKGVNSTSGTSNGKSSKAPKKSKASPCKSDSSSSLSDDLSGKEDKPVECSICLRRFKNTPALNGHMRLHGGYYNKKVSKKYT